ncbi:unnamed protein product, partial [Mesorhabditis belari]|uniref:Palmitoyltransferase n=1 Tax=Mesorhabditis belari TaxID=2138241 RepID=A0AAF3EYS9_9BILA
MNNSSPTPSQNSREDEIQELLNEFGKCLKIFRFDLAKDLVDEFRAKLGQTNCAINAKDNSWSLLMQSLAQIAVADRNYYQLSFLLPKMFFRKEDGLQRTYALIAEDLKNAAQNVAIGSVSEHLLSQCRHYVNARIQMIQLYILLANTADREWEELTRRAKIETEQTRRFSHPNLLALANLYQDEVDLLYLLLKLQCSIVDGNLVKSVTALKEVKDKFDKWLQPSEAAAANRAGFASWLFKGSNEKTAHKSRLITWLIQFKAHLLAKFTLYYCDSLGPYCNPTDLDTILTKQHIVANSPNYLTLCRDFVSKRSDIEYFYILMNRTERDEPFYGFHYVRTQNRFDQSQQVEPLKGLHEKFPIMLRLPIHYEPNSLPIPHRVDQYHDEIAQLIEGNGRKFFENTTLDKTFYCERLEEEIYAVAVLDGMKIREDVSVIAFLNELGLLVLVLLDQSMSWYSRIYMWVREYRQRNRVKGWMLTKSLNIMVIIQLIFLGYFQVMYLYAVCWQMLEHKQQAVFYICVFEGITILAFWSFMATIMTPVAKVPDKFRADAKTDGDLKANTPFNGKRYLPDQSTQDMMMQQMEILRTFCSERNICTMERDHFGERIRYCYECRLVKPDRAHHCSSCGFCVLKFDHHCPWINNCVHYGNYKSFLLYLSYSMTFLCWTTVTSLEAFVRYFVKAHWVDDLIAFLMIAVGILGCICFMYWPLGEMFNYHRGLVVLNETTCEQAKIPRIDGDPRADYNIGTLENLRQVFTIV